MSPYSIILFLHVVGALVLFFALGLEWICHRGLTRSGTAKKAREWMSLARPLRAIYPLTSVALLATGIYLSVLWGGQTWIVGGMVSLVLIASLGAGLTGPRMRALARAAAVESGGLSEGLGSRIHDPVLRVSLYVRLAVAFGVVFLMTSKPGSGGSMATLAIALVAGVGSSVPSRSGAPAAGPESGDAGQPPERDQLLALALELDELRRRDPDRHGGSADMERRPMTSGVS